MNKLMVAVAGVFFFSVVGVQAQNGPVATSVRVDKGQGIYGPLFVTIGGREQKIAEQAQQAWILSGGRYVVYSSSDGAGGYENEGQSLHVYDVRHAKTQADHVSVFHGPDSRGGHDKQKEASFTRDLGRWWFGRFVCCRR